MPAREAKQLEPDDFAFMRPQEDHFIIWALVGGRWMPYDSADTKDDAKRLTRKVSGRLRRAYERRLKEA